MSLHIERDLLPDEANKENVEETKVEAEVPTTSEPPKEDHKPKVSYLYYGDAPILPCGTRFMSDAQAAADRAIVEKVGDKLKR